MSSNKIFDNRLRPPVEFVPAFVSLLAATALLLQQDWFFPILNTLVNYIVGFLIVLGLYRAYQGLLILKYRSGLRKLPEYILTAKNIPTYRNKLFLGKGFRWTQRHSQRLVEARSPLVQKYLIPNPLYRAARNFELLVEGIPSLSWLDRITANQSPLNPVRPYPEVGGNSYIHGVGLENEQHISMNIGERVGHSLVLGTTRVGKTRFSEILMAQDIRRGDVTIFIDPKGDFEVLARMIGEAKRAGRLHHFHMLHLGHPEISERYNGIGDFGRITEVAGRIANQLPSEGNSAAFREFAWRFTNVVSRALTGLGIKPSYELIARYVTNIEPLVIDYYHLWLEQAAPANWQSVVQSIESSEDLLKRVPNPMKSRDRHAIALIIYAKDYGLFDPVADGLRSAIEYDKTSIPQDRVKFITSLFQIVVTVSQNRVDKSNQQCTMLYIVGH